MSVNQVLYQLQQDLQNELTTSNQLLYLITKELQQIKEFTNPGGKFEENITEVNATTKETMKIFMISDKDIEITAPNKQTKR